MAGEGSIGSMRLSPFVDEIHRVRGVARDDVREAFLAAARKVVEKHFGGHPRIEMSWNEDGGVVELRQVLTATRSVISPFRNLPLAALRTLPGLEEVKDGEELELSILYADADRDAAKELDAQLG